MLKTIIALTKPLRYWLDALTFNKSDASNEFLSWKDKYKNQPLLIIGNGPSLNNTPLDDFSNIPSIGMNKIDMIYKRTLWRPSCIVCVNNMVVKQNWRAFINSDIPVYLSWKSRFFVPRKYRKQPKYFLNFLSNTFSKDFSQGAGSSVTVTYMALQLAYYTGANPVILFGVDHSFKMDGSPSVYQRKEGDDENHFDPNYFAKGQYWGLPDLDQSEMDYYLAKKAFEADGRKVLDATIGGKLDVFEKVSLDDVYTTCGISRKSANSEEV